MSDADRKYSFENLPASLRASHRWLVWKYGEKENAKGKKPKLPVDLQSGRCVDKANAACYSFADVAAASGYEGIGFLPVHPYIGVDLDNCISDGAVSDFAKKVVQHCNSYTELSPSGKGLRIWVRGNAVKAAQDNERNPLGSNRLVVKDGLLEIYPDAPNTNYLTCTGNTVEGSPADVRELSEEEIRQLYAFTSKKETPASQPATRPTRVQRFNFLSLGQWEKLHASQSEADLEYCGFLAEAQNGDSQKIDADFRQSRLMRPKWDERHGADTYGNLTIQKVLKNFKSKKEDISADDWEKEFPALCDVKVEPCVEIVKDLLIKEGVHIFAGMFESYKTMAGIELSSAIWEKRPAFDYFPVFSSHPILYLCPDMGAGLFLEYQKPFNLTKHGGDFRICRVDADVLHSLDSAVMQRAVNGRILFVDTMLDYAHIKDGFQSGEWVEFFQKLRTLIRVHGCVAIVLIAHPTKAAGRASNTVIDPSEFLKDSVTVGGKADVAFAFKKVPNSGKVHVERIKGRFFKKRDFTFSLAVEDEQLNSNLDRGRFPICDKPEDKKGYADHVERQKPGRKSECTPEKRADARRLKNEGKTNAQIGKVHGVSGATVGNWLKGPQEEIPF
jgi:hypothetical protein